MGEIIFPIEVSGIKCDPLYKNSNKPESLFHQCGQLVSVRPCDEKYAKKTYLGILLGDLPIGLSAAYNRKTKELEIYGHKNPAIFVPELKEIIWGCGSWWGAITTEKELREITDADIQNTWYVKLLKEISDKPVPNKAQE
jgi:hypothetical protein